MIKGYPQYFLAPDNDPKLVWSIALWSMVFFNINQIHSSCGMYNNIQGPSRFAILLLALTWRVSYYVSSLVGASTIRVLANASKYIGLARCLICHITISTTTASSNCVVSYSHIAYFIHQNVRICSCLIGHHHRCISTTTSSPFGSSGIVVDCPIVYRFL